MEVKNKTLDFLLYSYFNILPDDFEKPSPEEKIALKCAQRAYLDLNRTLRFNDKLNNDKIRKDEKEKIKNDRKIFREEICKIIIKGILENLINTDCKKSFDKNHKELCENIRNEANEFKKDSCKDEYVLSSIPYNKNEIERDKFRFYDGHAQKWLNMTLKYMSILSLWDDKFDKINSFLHIPIDSYIIETVWHEGYPENGKGQLENKDNINKFDITLPADNKIRKNKYSSDKIVPWSKWTYDEYFSFQDSLRKSKLLNGKKPIEWENIAWIEATKKNNG